MIENGGHQPEFGQAEGPPEGPEVLAIENPTINRNGVIVESRVENNKKGVDDMDDQEDQNPDTSDPVEHPRPLPDAPLIS